MRYQVTITVLLALAGVAIVSADPTEGAVTIDQLVAQLDAQDYEVREQATTALMLREDLDDAALRRAFQSTPTSEKEHRLRRIALHKYFSRIDPSPEVLIPTADAPATDPPSTKPDPLDRPALGIATGKERRIVQPHEHTGLKQSAFLITETLPGFPAFPRLRPGDMITAIDGNTLSPESPDIAQLLQSCHARQEVRLDVLRDDQPLQFTLRLAPLHRLNSVYPGNRPTGGWTQWALNEKGFQDYLTSLQPERAKVTRIEVISPPGAARAQNPGDPDSPKPGDAT